MRRFGTISPYFVILDTEARTLTELELVPVRLRRFQLQRPPDEDRN